MAVFQNALYFSANDGVTGRELWRLDAAGVLSLVADIVPGAGSSSPDQLTVAGDRLYFRASTPEAGVELWMYDGSNPPELAADVNPGPTSGNLLYLTSYADQVVFQADDGTHGRELFAFDPVNRLRLFDIEPVSVSCPSAPDCWSSPESLTVYSGILYFSAFTSGAGFQLYGYDGSTYARLTNNIAGATLIAGLGNRLIFGGFDFGQYRVYSYDIGSAAGVATKLSDATMRNSGTLSLNGYEPVVFNNRVYFAADDGINGEEVWGSDGTVAGTSLAAELTPGPTSSLPKWLTVFNGELYFRAADPTSGLEPRAFNGAAHRLVADLNPGAPGSNFEMPAILGPYLIFQASGAGNLRPWYTTGSQTTTDIVRTASGGLLVTEDPHFTFFNGALYLAASDGVTGTELWRIGLGARTPTTTSIVSSLNPSIAGDQITFTATVSGSSPTGTVTFLDDITPLGSVALAGGTASLDVSTLGAGNHTITARYNGDAANAASVSGPLVQIVQLPPTTSTTTTLTSSPNPSIFGQAVTLTATVAGGTPSGTVTFFDGVATIATAVLVGNTATSVVASLGGGSHSLTARYDGDGGHAQSTSAPVTHVVTRAATSTTLSSAPNPSVLGAMVEFTAIVASASGLLSGDVTFSEDGTVLQVVSFSGNTASFQTSTLAPGSHTITATYSGNSNHAGSVSNAVVHVVTQPATLVVVKQVINDDGGTATPASFTINVSGSTPSPSTFAGDATGTVVTLGAGSYSVVEVASADYAVTYSQDCSGAIAGGETKTCTITNNDRPATLRLTKFVVNDNGGTAVPADWILTANGQPFASGVTAPVLPGAFTLAESGGPSGYTASGWSCTGGALAGTTVTVPPHTAVECTITNDYQPASLTLTKFVVNDNGGTAAPGDWQLRAGPVLFASGVAQPFSAGTHALTESGGPAGYAAGSWSCSGGVLAGSALTLQNGQTASCTITNDDLPGTLTVRVQVINDHGGQAQPGDVTVTVIGTNPAPASFPGSAATAVTLDAGAYSVGSSALPGYTMTTSGECSSTMPLAGIKVCTIAFDDPSTTNQPPVAHDQLVQTDEDVPVAIVLTAADPDSAVLTYAVVAGPAAGSLSGTAPTLTYTPNPGYFGPDSFTFKTNDGSADSNIATVTITVRPVRADVGITISDAPDPVTVGELLTYTIQVTNNGPAVALNTTLSLPLPAGLALVSAPGCVAGPPLTCAIGVLAVNESRTYAVVVRPEITAPITATAAVSSTAPDPVTGNDMATATTTVVRAVPTMTLLSAPSPSVFGQPVTLTASVTGYNPSGTVLFTSDGGALGSAPVVSGVATLTASLLPTGLRSLGAAYPGDVNNEPSAASAIEHTVNRIVTTTALVSSLNPSAAGQPVTFSATVAGGSPSGTVTFFVDGTAIGSATLAGNTAQLTTSSFAAGSYAVSASYGGDVNHTPSMSNTVVAAGRPGRHDDDAAGRAQPVGAESGGAADGDDLRVQRRGPGDVQRRQSGHRYCQRDQRRRHARDDDAEEGQPHAHRGLRGGRQQSGQQLAEGQTLCEVGGRTNEEQIGTEFGIIPAQREEEV